MQRQLIIATLALALSGPALGSANAQTFPSNDVKDCRAHWDAVGVPQRSAEADEEPVFVCRRGYVLEHNNETKTPNWVIERLTKDVVGAGRDRPNIKFKADNMVQPDTAQARPPDYAKSGYAIGHQAPSADFKSSDDLMKETFFLSNAVPQEGLGFNSGVWSSLERLTRNLVETRDEIVVITGPIYQSRKVVKINAAADACRRDISITNLDEKSICEARNKDSNARCPQGVAIPAALYKIVYSPNDQRANAFLFLNVDHRPIKKTAKTLEYIAEHQVGVNSIEALTGYEFFSALSDRKRRQVTETCNPLMLH